ncbi:MAG: thiol-disulfide oxidoreductase DCC family protein, partial [Acidimicrobiales bacterium]
AREAAWWVAPDGRLSRGHLAIGCALVAGGGWSAVMGRALASPPLRWIGAPAYAAVSRMRHCLPGATSSSRS